MLVVVNDFIPHVEFFVCHYVLQGMYLLFGKNVEDLIPVFIPKTYSSFNLTNMELMI